MSIGSKIQKIRRILAHKLSDDSSFDEISELLSDIVILSDAKDAALENNIISIDKVTTVNLDLALRMVGIKTDIETIDKIIDIVELIESKGDDVSIKDICQLQSEWED